MMKNILINTRCLLSPTTGVQRYTKEIIGKLPVAEIIAPKMNSSGIEGHLWEQLILPGKVKNKLLWSPANTGPLAISSQVITIHDLSSLEHPEWFSKKFSFWYGLITPILAKKVHHIIAVSNYTKTRIVERLGIPEEKVSVIYNAANAEFQIQDKDEGHSRLQELKLPQNYLLAVGSIEPRKNLPRLLQAWCMIQNKLPQDVHLVIVGGKGKVSVFQELTFTVLPNNLEFTGYVSQNLLPSLYSGALGFVYPSLYEGFGLPPIEAMACGTPVITSNTTSLPEVVGNAGIMVNPLDTEEIANAIQTLVENSQLRQELSQKGLQRAKLFSWDKTAALTWKVLQEAAEQK